MFDFTLKNKKILDYFEDVTEVAPVTELLYIHTHPLIRPNFLTEVEELLKVACEKATKAGLPQEAYIPMLTEQGITLGTNIENLTEVNALKVLAAIKRLYQFTKEMNLAYK